MGVTDTLFVDTLPATLADIAMLRHRFVHWFKRTGTPADRAGDILIACNEAVTNAVLHGSALDAANTVHVEACHRADGLIVSVSDPGRWQPGIERDPTVGGRGFKIMERVSDEVTIDTGPLGTTVALRWARDS